MLTLIANRLNEIRLNSHVVFFVVLVSLTAGFLLSVLSWMELCVQHCSANHDWRLFGLPFAWIGIAFFTFFLGLHVASWKFPSLRKWVGRGIAAAFGAEVMFIIIQKKQIGHWCPVCLSIAASIGIAGIVLSIPYLTKFYRNILENNRGHMIERIKSGAFTLCYIALGFLMAFLGASRAEAGENAGAEIRDKIAFGKKGSSVEIYLFTDWFCPACRNIEPTIEKLYPKIKSDALFIFVDYPIHKKSMNFTPYNLAFMVHNKADYFTTRKFLHELSSKTDSPNDEDVLKAAKKDGVKLDELSFLDVKNGMELFDKLVDKFDLNATPTMIILNTKNNRVVKLEGQNEITVDKVLEGIDKVRQLSKK